MAKHSCQLAFITVNYNGLSDTRELLDSIAQANLTLDYRVVVIDNGSAVDEWAPLQDAYPWLLGMRSAQNLGFAGGNNLAFALLDADYYYFINNDTLLPAGANEQLLAMIDFLASHPKVGGLSPKIKYVDNPDMLQFAGCTPLSTLSLRNRQIGYQEIDKGQYDVATAIPYMHGAAMLLKRAVIDKVGPMPELYFLYYEELDWCHAIGKYYELYYYPKASILHKESASTGMDSPFKTYYLSRNRLIYAYRNRTGWTRIGALCYLFIVNTIHALRHGIKGQLAHSKAIGKGMRDGFSWMLKRNKG